MIVLLFVAIGLAHHLQRPQPAQRLPDERSGGGDVAVQAGRGDPPQEPDTCAATSDGSICLRRAAT